MQTNLKKRLDMRKACARWVPHLLTEEQKTQPLKCARELLKTYKSCNSRAISSLLTGEETWVHMFKPQRRADNKQWKQKDKKKRQCIAKRTLSSKKMLYAIFFKWASRSSALSLWSYSHWPILQEFCTEESEKSSPIRNDQAKNGQECTFYMTRPPLISVRLLSLFWLLKR